MVGESVAAEMFKRNYADVFTGDEEWNAVDVPEGDRYDLARLDLRAPAELLPGHPRRPARDRAGRGRPRPRRARRLGHHRPHLARRRDQKRKPGREWLTEQGVEPGDFNSYGSRRGNHEVMIRGTFANIRLRNQLVEKAGGFTRHFPDGAETTIYDAAMAYADEGVPLVVLAGKEYGSGSSRDWAAKGTKLLGVGAVIAESFERIHRSNLIGMGVDPPPVRRRRERREPRPHRHRDDHDRRPRRGQGQNRHRHRHHRLRRLEDLRGQSPPRHPQRDHLHQQRRHPPDRPPQPEVARRRRRSPA